MQFLVAGASSCQPSQGLVGGTIGHVSNQLSPGGTMMTPSDRGLFLSLTVALDTALDRSAGSVRGTNQILWPGVFGGNG